MRMTAGREFKRERVSYYAKREDHLRHFQFLKIHEPSFHFFQRSVQLWRLNVFLRLFCCSSSVFHSSVAMPTRSVSGPKEIVSTAYMCHHFLGGVKGAEIPSPDHAASVNIFYQISLRKILIESVNCQCLYKNMVPPPVCHASSEFQS